MKRKVEEDMVNVAPNQCVLLYFLSPGISKHDRAQSPQFRLKVTELMNRSRDSCVLYLYFLLSRYIKNLLLLFAAFRLLGIVVIVHYVKSACAVIIIYATTKLFWLAAPDC